MTARIWKRDALVRTSSLSLSRQIRRMAGASKAHVNGLAGSNPLEDIAIGNGARPGETQPPSEPAGDPMQIDIGAYDGRNVNVLAMQAYLRDHNLFDDLLAATLHGSLASKNEIAYSDFDSLVVIRNTTLSDPKRLARVARHLSDARVIMHQQDPLQHHGWFVLPEFMLGDYPDAYLPVATLCSSLSLGDDIRIPVSVSWRSNIEGFQSFAARTSSEIESGQMLTSLYQLKSTLSKFMLLPAVYLQARDGMGVTKQQSFDRLRVEINIEMTAMDRVSDVRARWNCPDNALLRRASRSAPWLRTVGVKRIAPRVPQWLLRLFDHGLRTQMLEFVGHLGESLTVHQCEVIA